MKKEIVVGYDSLYEMDKEIFLEEAKEHFKS